MSEDPSQQDMRRLLRNLDAIDQVNPELGQRIRMPVSSDHVVQPFGDNPQRLKGRGQLPLRQSPESLLEPSQNSHNPYFFFG